MSWKIVSDEKIVQTSQLEEKRWMICSIIWNYSYGHFWECLFENTPVWCRARLVIIILTLSKVNVSTFWLNICFVFGRNWTIWEIHSQPVSQPVHRLLIPQLYVSSECKFEQKIFQIDNRKEKWLNLNDSRLLQTNYL